jgi:putative transcriptional regulator
MKESSYLAGQLLVAMPTMNDPNFYHTVMYLCEHSPEGAMGIIINQPLEVTVKDLLKHLKIDITEDENHEDLDKPVLAGGPIARERGFVLHYPASNWESTLIVNSEYSITTSRDILVAMIENRAPEKSFIAMGYAGWDAGQLEAELAQNLWLTAPANPDILFNTPFSQRWRASAQLIGVDVDKISGDIGHA